jgi:EpsI family protein
MLPVLLGLSLLWVVSYRSAIEIAHQVALPLLVWTAVYLAMGREVAKRCGFAVAYWYFAIPIWSFAIGPLQFMTTWAVQAAVRVAGVPAYVEGNTVHIAAGVFEIADGCSGVHYFIVALAIAALYGELHRDAWRIRILLVLLAATLAMVSNWIRVVTIVIAGHLTDMRHYLVTVDHYYFGWLLFAASMILFFFVANRLPVANRAPAAASPMASAQRRAPVLSVALALGVSALGPVWLLAAPSAQAASGRPSILASASGWQGPDRPASYSWKPLYRGADVQDRAVYTRQGRTVMVYVATYLSQHQGKELVGHDNSVIGDTPARIEDVTRIPLGEAVVNEARLNWAGTKTSLLQYYYQVGRVRTPSAPVAQLLYGWSSLFAIADRHILRSSLTARPLRGSSNAHRSSSNRLHVDRKRARDSRLRLPARR